MTLPELLVATGLAALTLLLALGGLGELQRRWSVYAAAHELAATLSAARAKAAFETRPIAVTFEAARGRYAVVALAPLPGAAAPFRGVLRLPRGLSFRCPDGSPSVTFAPPGTGDRAALFDAGGRLRSDPLPAHACVAGEGGREFRRVRVDAAGRVRVQRWDGAGAWQ